MPGNDQSQFDAPTALCRRFERDLSAYLEGEDKPEVLAHAQQCPYCRVVLADLDQIRFAAHHLSLEEPPARVWANVRATLEAEGIIVEQVLAWHRWLARLVFRHEPAPLAALACLAMLGLTLVVSPGSLRTPGTVEGSPAGVKTTAAAAFAPLVSDELTRTVKQMESAYRARESFLEPAMKDAYRKSLKSLDASIEESLLHCQHDPGSLLAREYLVSAYQLKAEVLESALESVAR